MSKIEDRVVEEIIKEGIISFCKKRIIPEIEDNRCDTGKGTMGDINYFCPECNNDITEEIETLKFIKIEKKFKKEEEIDKFIEEIEDIIVPVPEGRGKMVRETKCLGVLIQEINDLFIVKPKAKRPTNMFCLICDEKGWWHIDVIDDWHKWLKKGLELKYVYATPELACIKFLEFVEKNKINVKSLQNLERRELK